MAKENETYNTIQIDKAKIKSDIDNLVGIILNYLDEFTIKKNQITPKMRHDGKSLVCDGNVEGRFFFDVDATDIIDLITVRQLVTKIKDAFSDDPIQLHGVHDDMGYVVELQLLFMALHDYKDGNLDTPEVTFRIETKWQDLQLA